MNSERLKIAIQKSGRLADESQKLLQNCGIKLTKSKDQLYCTSLNFPLDIYFIRDDDIPSFVASKVCQIGIVGRNVIKEEQILKKNKSIKNVSLISSLEFGKCRLVIAVPHEFKYEGIKSLQGKVIATSYEGILKDYLHKNNIICEIVKMNGAVEIAPRISMADAICDIVSTGTTLAMNGLKEVESILNSQAEIICNDSMNNNQKKILERLMLRIRGVQQADSSKYIMLHSPVKVIDDIIKVIPGVETPTILNLKGRNDLVAVHAVCKEGIFWQTMEDLKDRGASSILVLPIEKILK